MSKRDSFSITADRQTASTFNLLFTGERAKVTDMLQSRVLFDGEQVGLDLICLFFSTLVMVRPKLGKTG